MRGLFAAFMAFAVLFSATQAAGAQQDKPKQQSSSSPAVHNDAQRPVSGRSTKSKSAISASPTFRAEDIVPDICRGCTS